MLLLVQLSLLVQHLFLQAVDLRLVAFGLYVLLNLRLENVTLVLQPPTFAPRQGFVVDLELEVKQLLLLVLVIDVAQVDVILSGENVVLLLDRGERLRLLVLVCLFGFVGCV